MEWSGVVWGLGLGLGVGCRGVVVLWCCGVVVLWCWGVGVVGVLARDGGIGGRVVSQHTSSHLFFVASMQRQTRAKKRRRV